MARSKRMAVIDCETDPFAPGRIPVPFCWGYYDDEVGFLEWWGPDCTSLFVEFLKGRKVVAYAHNGGRFDFHYLSEYFEVGSKPLLINGRIAKMPFGKAELRDSWCVAPLPLSKLGAKLDFDYALMEAHVREQNRGQIIEYLRVDCVELYEYLSRFERVHGRSLTIASAAMKAWREMSPEEDAPPKTSPRYYDMIAPWYAGGRVEARERGVVMGDFQLIDINSAYPHAMMSLHPYGGSFLLDRKQAAIHAFDPEVRRFYHVRATHDGCLWRRTDTGGLTFAPESGDYYVTDWELQAGIETDSVVIHEVYETMTFEETLDFAPYVDTWFAEKRRCEEAEDATGRLIAKLFLNSLYGKFGANPGRYLEYLVDDIGWASIDGGKAGDWYPGPELGEVQVYARPLPPSRRRYYDVATAASITGYVRAMMWRAIHASDRVLYCDTDSMIGSGLGAALGSALGEWDVEVPKIDRVAIGGKKLYAAFDGNNCVKQANKGVKISAAEILAIAEGAVVTYESVVPTYSFGVQPRFMKRRVRATR